MYLSRLLLNPTNRDAWRDVASPYELHRTLERILEEHPDAGRTLFRVETWKPGMKGVPVLVQTASAPPDWSTFSYRYCLHIDGPKRVAPDLQTGQRLAFRLLGNPTKKQGNKRIALDDEKDYHGWLARKAEQSGFRVLQVAASPYWINEDQLGKQGRYTKQNIPHFAVRYDGVLRVADPEKLTEAMRRGIGPAKAFGFGLLSLAQAR